MNNKKNNLGTFRYNLTIISSFIAILIASIFLFLRLFNILPQDYKTIIAICIFLTITGSLLFIMKYFTKYFYITQKIAFVFINFVLFAIAYITQNVIVLIWLSFLIMVVSVTSDKFFLFFLSILISLEMLFAEFIYPPLHAPLFIKLVIFISFIAFSILGFLISQQLEKFAYENEAQKALLEKMTLIDFLTETYNRRAFFKLANTLIGDALRNHQQLGIIMLDIDHFKKINDTYGHHIGDVVLRDFSLMIKNNIRENDLFARIGGEEFVILTKINNISHLYNMCDKILYITNNLIIKENDIILKITVSIGCYIFDPLEENLESALNKADIALYEAKKTRNTFVIFPDLKKKFIS